MPRKLPPRLHHKHGRYYYVCRVDGRVKWRALGTDYAHALQQWAEIEGQAPRQAKTVGQLVTHYLQSIAAKVGRGERKQATLTSYQISATRLAPFDRMPLEDLRPPHVFQYLQRAKGRTQANRDIALLSAAYKLANAMGWLREAGYNPCRAVPRNTERARQRYITDAEFSALCAAAAPKIRALFVLASIIALRPADLRALRWSQVTPEGITVTPSKRGRATLYARTDAMTVALDAARAAGRAATTGSMLVFPGKNGQPYTRSGLAHVIRATAKRAGIADVRLHDMRRKAGSDLPLERAVELLGHADPRVTTRHYRAAPRVVQPVR